MHIAIRRTIYGSCSFMGCDTVQFGRQALTFRENLLTSNATRLTSVPFRYRLAFLGFPHRRKSWSESTFKE
jgi:hypothetical protein